MRQTRTAQCSVLRSHTKPCSPSLPINGTGLTDNEPLSEGKQTLLRALESIEEAEQDMDAEVSFLAVVYEIHSRTEKGNIAHSGGWNHSDAPDWVISAMLRRTADAIDNSPYLDEDEE